MRIVVAENDPAARKKLVSSLLDWGHEVFPCVDGHAAYTLFRQEMPDIVIADWRIDQIPGVELCRMIRKAYHPAYPFVLIVTAQDGESDQQLGYEVGADDFLTKPIKDVELLTRLRSCERIINLQLRQLKLQQRCYTSLKQLKIQHQKLENVMQELTTTERQLHNALAQVGESTKMKTAFLANMSHELRTPLNAIIGYSDILSEEMSDIVPTEWHNILTKVTGASKHLLMVINDLLDLSRIEACRLELSVERFDVMNLVHDVVGFVEPLVRHNNNHFEIQSSNVIAHMTADPVRVQQILYNVLSNAAKFTTDGTIRLVIKEVQERDELFLRFEVTDTGIGLTDAQMKIIFLAFAQVDPSTTRCYEGTGLGLAITKQLCEMMRGSISVTSALGKGAKFAVMLPEFACEVKKKEDEYYLHHFD